jgi:hypothetical protein
MVLRLAATMSILDDVLARILIATELSRKNPIVGAQTSLKTKTNPIWKAPTSSVIVT